MRCDTGNRSLQSRNCRLILAPRRCPCRRGVNGARRARCVYRGNSGMPPAKPACLQETRAGSPHPPCRSHPPLLTMHARSRPSLPCRGSPDKRCRCRHRIRRPDRPAANDSHAGIFSAHHRCPAGADRDNSRIASAPRLRGRSAPVETSGARPDCAGRPAPAGISPPAPVPVILKVTFCCPPETFTVPIARDPSWQDRQSLELPPGCASWPAIVSASIDEDM